MKKSIILTLMMVFTTLQLVGCTSNNKAKTHIDWMDFIKFDDITYYSNDYMTKEERSNIELGEVYHTVKKKIAGVISDTNYMIKNGDAAFYEKGTRVYSVVGYDPKFRLAVESIYGIRVYEAVTNPNATMGNDILDIKDKVQYITLNSEEDAQKVIITIDNETDIKKIITMILESPLNENTQKISDKRYFLKLYLLDGTTITRCYWYNDNILEPNIRLNDKIVNIFNKYLNEIDDTDQIQ